MQNVTKNPARIIPGSKPVIEESKPRDSIITNILPCLVCFRLSQLRRVRGITCVSLVTGSIDIMCTCLFRETSDLFKIIESIKTIERVDKVSWAEEVHNIPSKETTISTLQGSINTSTQDSHANDSSHTETVP